MLLFILILIYYDSLIVTAFRKTSLFPILRRLQGIIVLIGLLDLAHRLLSWHVYLFYMIGSAVTFKRYFLFEIIQVYNILS